MLGQILMLVLVLLIIPFCVGLIPTNFIEKKNRSLGVVYIAGFITTLAVFQIIAVPIVIVDGHGFKWIVFLFTVITALLAITGVIVSVYRSIQIKKKSMNPETKDRRSLGMEAKQNAVSELEKKHKLKDFFREKENRESIIFWIFAIALIIYQMVMAFYYTSFDGDDAYYIVQSVLTDETNTLYRIRPYTGLSTAMDLRHALAVFPIWIAYIARMTGVHATIVAHMVLPLVLIPLVYLIYLEIGKKIFKRETYKLPVFMIFISVMQIWGNVSIYTSQTFFLTRTWQGKSLLANLVLPAIIWLIFWIFDGDAFEKEQNIGLWILLILTNFVAAMCSTASVFLAAMLIGVTGLVLGIREKNVQIPLRLIITCVPLVLYGVIYLLL